MYKQAMTTTHKSTGRRLFGNVAGERRKTSRFTQEKIADFRREANLIWSTPPLPNGSRQHVDMIYCA